MLTANEKAYLLNSMEDLLEEYDYEYSTWALSKIVDEWSVRKAGLIEAFKKHPNYIEGKFMIAFDADYERKIERSASYDFKSWVLCTALPLVQEKLPIDATEISWSGNICVKNSIWDFFYYLAGRAQRTISEETAKCINNMLPNIHAHVGQKTSRVINKICVYLGIDKVNGYNREFAKYADSLSPMIIKRHTVLSLNPLDYLTMSFGNSWASCHTIDKENKRHMPNDYSGCYSSGTISYMLDESSMVLYTVDASYEGNEYWKQPKINRQMFHYGEEKLVQARLYPQDNDGADDVYAPYRNVVQNIISEIFGFPNLWTLSKGREAASRYIHSSGTHYKDYTHYDNCTLSVIKGSENKEYIKVGARPICIDCGCRHNVEDNINHCASGYICSDCGCRVSEGYVIWINGDPYCSDCCSYCDSCGEYHTGHSTYIEGRNIYVCDYCRDNYYTYCECCNEWEHNDDIIYVECDDRYVCESCLHEYYFYCDDCGEYYRREDRETYDYLTLCPACYTDRVAKEENEEVC